MQICWFLISPAALVTVFVAGCATWTKPSYGAVQYPDWAHVIGWLLLAASVVQIPVWFLVMTALSVVEGRCRAWPTFRPAQSWLDRRQVGSYLLRFKNVLEVQMLRLLFLLSSKERPTTRSYAKAK